MKSGNVLYGGARNVPLVFGNPPWRDNSILWGGRIPEWPSSLANCEPESQRIMGRMQRRQLAALRADPYLGAVRLMTRLASQFGYCLQNAHFQDWGKNRYKGMVSKEFQVGKRFAQLLTTESDHLTFLNPAIFQYRYFLAAETTFIFQLNSFSTSWRPQSQPPGQAEPKGYHSPETHSSSSSDPSTFPSSSPS